jgi:hypothetical protein
MSNININFEKEIENIFLGNLNKNIFGNIPKIINTIVKDNKIFDEPKEWYNSYDLLKVEKKSDNYLISFIFLYFEFNETRLKYFLDNFNKDDINRIKYIKNNMKDKETNNILNELISPKNLIKSKTDKKNKEVNSDQNSKINNNNGNTYEETYNTNYGKEINYINDENQNDNKFSNENINNDINIAENITSENNHKENIDINEHIIKLYDEIMKLNEDIKKLKSDKGELENKVQKLIKDNIEKEKKISDNKKEINNLINEKKIEKNNISLMNQKIERIDNKNKTLSKRVNNLEKLIFASNLNINFLGNRDYYKTTLAIILYTEKLNIYMDNEKKFVKSQGIIAQNLVEHFSKKFGDKTENKNQIKIVEFLFLCIKCCEQVMHKLTISNLSQDSNINTLKLFSDNNFSNMIDSLTIFMQPEKLDELFNKRIINKSKNTEFLRDDYQVLIENVLIKDLKKGRNSFQHLFTKQYKLGDKNFKAEFSFTPQILIDYFNKMKFEQTYQNCYKNTDWKLMKFGIFDLNWG